MQWESRGVARLMTDREELERMLLERNRLYQGYRSAALGTLAVTVNGQPLRHVERHSPDGFEWGYAGSGPADLALSLLTDAVGERIARANYQPYKHHVVAGLPYAGWKLTRRSMIHWLLEHGRLDREDA